jgi:integrase
VTAVFRGPARESRPAEEVSKLLGHESIKTTERHYAKWVKGRQDRLDALLSETWKTQTE